MTKAKPKILSIITIGNTLLLERSKEVEDISAPHIQELIEDMFFTITSTKERVGLAAPQVGSLQRIVIFRIPQKSVNPRYNSISDDNQEEVPWNVLINPVITPLTDEMLPGFEGCISVPGMMGEVERYTKIRYTAINEKGDEIDRIATGFHARVVQHECDHLDGILFPMRLKDQSLLIPEDEFVAKGVSK